MTFSHRSALPFLCFLFAGIPLASAKEAPMPAPAALPKCFLKMTCAGPVNRATLQSPHGATYEKDLITAYFGPGVGGKIPSLKDTQTNEYAHVIAFEKACNRERYRWWTPDTTAGAPTPSAQDQKLVYVKTAQDCYPATGCRSGGQACATSSDCCGNRVGVNCDSVTHTCKLPIAEPAGEDAR